jgi:cob(I)alamin adenosyltransferase
VKLYTRTGDDGTTGLRLGDRVRKDSAVIEANGAIDEAQAALGLARAELERDSAMDTLLVAIERDLWIVMAEVATPPGRRDRLELGTSAVNTEMVERLEDAIDETMASVELSPHFAVPGDTRASAALDFARTVVRRAERAVVRLDLGDSLVGIYLNRLSDLCFALARASEDSHLVQVRETRARRSSGEAHS